MTLIAMLAGCASRRDLAQYHRLDLPAHSNAPTFDEAAASELLAELRSGDIILGVKEDPITALVRLVTVQPTYFTHSGTIEIVENDHGERAARVWHAIGDFSLLHLSPHVLGKVRGGVRTIALDDFIRMYDTLAIVRLPDDAKNRTMVEVCKRLQSEKAPFDPFVDCIDHSTICCTELTAMAIEQAGYAFDLQPAPRTRNVAISNLMYGWNITTPAIFMAGQFEHLPGAKTVAALAQYERMETYLAMRDASALLHERVAAGELQASDFTGFDAGRMTHYQPRMELFMRAVEGLSRAAPTMESQEIRTRNVIALREAFQASNTWRCRSLPPAPRRISKPPQSRFRSAKAIDIGCPRGQPGVRQAGSLPRR